LSPRVGRRVLTLSSDANKALQREGDGSDPGLEPGWVDAAVAGDSGAFTRLYDQHVDRIYRHILYRIGNRVDAEDVTQQVFLQAWRAIARYERRTTPFVAWLLTIAHNSVVNFYRRARVTDPIDLELPTTGRWADPEAATMAVFDQLAVRRAILRLKPDQQQVILMRFAENIEYADIAAALGKKEGNIRVIQHRALVELKRLLAPEVRNF
jgi:RNA polymerase sigma-70 factor (ECF subfamily)